MSRADTYERYMLDLINVERAKVGAPPLQLEQNLNEAADAHSEWMLRVDVFDHTGVNGSSPTARMRAADFDFRGSWRSAENIAVQSERGPDGIMDDVANLHTSLMNSPGHRANILNPALDYIGIGIKLGDFDFNSGTYESVIVTQNFASTGGTVDLDPAPVATQPPVVASSQNALNVVVAADPEPEPAADPEPTATLPQQTPIQQTPVQQTPVHQTPVQQTPAQPTAPQPAVTTTTNTPTAPDPAEPADTIGDALFALLAGGTGTNDPALDAVVFGPNTSQRDVADHVIAFAQDHAAIMIARLNENDGPVYQPLLEFDDLAF